MKKVIFVTASLAVILLVGTYILSSDNLDQDSENQGMETRTHNNVPTSTETVVLNAYVPWDVVFLPNGDMMFTERSGVLKVIGDSGVEIEVSDVVERGEGGLMGIALHPEYNSNSYLYLYYTTVRNGNTINRVVRYVFDGELLTEDRVIVDNIPGGSNHNGGRIAFGPDGQFYITTGDAGISNLAQDVNSLAGKILRVSDDGEVPSDNPFGNEVYSYGHRNPQGVTWDGDGNMWSTEHGRSGIESGLDELNLIERGANYGWPIIQGDETRDGMRAPKLHSGPAITWAPAGIAYRGDSLFFVGLRGRTLYEVPIEIGGELGAVREYYSGEFGRLRGISAGENGDLYISTSNRDGRGSPSHEDDRIIRVLFE